MSFLLIVCFAGYASDPNQSTYATVDNIRALRSYASTAGTVYPVPVPVPVYSPGLSGVAGTLYDSRHVVGMHAVTSPNDVTPPPVAEFPPESLQFVSELGDGLHCEVNI